MGENNCLTCSDVSRDINNGCECKVGYYNVGENPVCSSKNLINFLFSIPVCLITKI